MNCKKMFFVLSTQLVLSPNGCYLILSGLNSVVSYLSVQMQMPTSLFGMIMMKTQEMIVKRKEGLISIFMQFYY